MLSQIQCTCTINVTCHITRQANINARASVQYPD